jgi:hypothetical protein
MSYLSSSVFDLIQNAGELQSSNMGMAQSYYQEEPGDRTAVGTQFESGLVKFRLDNAGTNWWIPAKSYWRIRATFGMCRDNGEPFLPIQLGADIAPAMGFCSTLFKSVEAIAKDKTIERVSERVAEIGTIRTRIGMSKSWLDSTGFLTNMWGASFAERHNMIAQQGYLANRVDGYGFGSYEYDAVDLGYGGGTTAAYNSATQLVTLVPNTPLDENNVSIRRGDIFRISAANRVFQVLHTVDSTDQPSSLLFNVTELKGNSIGDIVADVDFGLYKIADSETNLAPGASSFEMIYKPELGLFDYQNGLPPGAQWEILFNPFENTQYKQRCVESQQTALVPRRGDQAQNLQDDFDVDITFFRAYFFYAVGDRFDNGSYYIDTIHARCQLAYLPTNATSLTQTNFEVQPKTNAMAIAFQDQEMGVNTLRSVTRFIIRRTATAPFGQQMNLTRMWIQYNSEIKPRPDWTGQYLAPSETDSLVFKTNYWLRLWTDTLLESNQFFSEGGSEDFNTWVVRGPFIYNMWPKDAYANNTRVNVNTQFSTPFSPAGSMPILLLFNFWRSATRFYHRNGELLEVGFENP